MTCYDEILYTLYLDNELGPEERLVITGHLKDCASCQEQVRILAEENRLLRESFKTPRTPDITATVMTRLQQRQAVKKAPFPWWLTIAASFLVAVLLFSGLVFKHLSGAVPEQHVILCSAKVNGQPVEGHMYQSNDSDIQFIWLEKDDTDK